MIVPVNKDRSLLAKLLIALLVAFALLISPLGATEAYAKSLKASGVKFTKEGRVINSKTWWGGAGLQNCTYTVKSIKIKKAKKAGYKTATIILEIREKWTPNNQQVISMANYGDDDGELEDGWIWAFVVDGKTGEYLDNKRGAKKYGITCKTTGWHYLNEWRYTASDGSWVEFPRLKRLKYTITYPKSYKNLCVGIGVGQRKYNESAMNKFEAGRVTYAKSWWNKYNNGSTHFVRVK